MKINTLTLLALTSLLGLSACITPRIQMAPAATPPPAAGATTAQPQARPDTSAPRRVASANLQQLLGTQLLCPGKPELAIAQTRAMAVGEGLIGRQAKQQPDGSTAHAVLGDLSVFGFKVTALAFTGEDNSEGATIQATVNATPAELGAFYKAKRIPVKKPKNGSGYWATRPLGMSTGYIQDENGVHISCSVMID
jgi:hypothetical protein